METVEIIVYKVKLTHIEQPVFVAINNVLGPDSIQKAIEVVSSRWREIPLITSIEYLGTGYVGVTDDA